MEKYEINESNFERAMRTIVGMVLIIAATVGFIGWWGYIGIVPFVTGLWGFCPLYKLLGLSSIPLPLP